MVFFGRKRSKEPKATSAPAPTHHVFVAGGAVAGAWSAAAAAAPAPAAGSISGCEASEAAPAASAAAPKEPALARLRSLRREGVSGLEKLRQELPGILEALSDPEVAWVRSALDSDPSAVVGASGAAGNVDEDAETSAGDLRSLVCRMDANALRRVLVRLHDACGAPPSCLQPGVVVVHDVEELVAPLLQRALTRPAEDSDAEDDEWRGLEAAPLRYPGLSRLSRELRAGLPPERSYPVLLARRPALLPTPLREQLGKILGGVSEGAAGSCASVLPSACAGVPSIDAFSQLPRLPGAPPSPLRGASEQTHGEKVVALCQYAWLFPDYAGRFAYVCDEDDAHGPAAGAATELALELLSLAAPFLQGCKSSQWLGDDRPLFAFAAVRARPQASRAASGEVGAALEARLLERLAELRRLHPARSVTAPWKCDNVAIAGEGEYCPRHRFFYFTDYPDLAAQLAAAGWLSGAQGDAVARCATRDTQRAVSTSEDDELGGAVVPAFASPARTGYCFDDTWGHCGSCAVPKALKRRSAEQDCYDQCSTSPFGSCSKRPEPWQQLCTQQ
eukprot:TRINITY_DN24166_c0_g1_i1.p1 TRINITY_DN24166_c0_g1~~TRINITY_DN24166_c0_g1_i1.p1  ORF type:complete len:561 (-),score=133.22 TRINITY_DN24166_c0_g1_i1:12-1694(-)